MLFWPLSEHRFYANGQLYSEIPPNFTATWDRSVQNLSQNLDFVRFHSGDSPEAHNLIFNSWQEQEITSKFKTALEISKIPVELLEQTLPEHILFPILDARLLAMRDILQTWPRSPDYAFLAALHSLFDAIATHPIRFAKTALKGPLSTAAKKYISVAMAREPYIKYSKTRGMSGRLRLEHDSFPIHSICKECREYLVPNNDVFIELDYNAMDLRCIYGLCGVEQEKEDPYERLNRTIFGGSVERSEIKRRVYAYAYNDDSHDEVLGTLFSKPALFTLIRSGGDEFPAGKEIAYKVQKTASDVMLKAKVAIAEKLKNNKSYVAFSIHDSVVLDFAKEDKDLIRELIMVFSQTQFGQFVVNAKIGKNYGSMKRLI